MSIGLLPAPRKRFLTPFLLLLAANGRFYAPSP
jgi:hypothetical protein